MAKTASREHTRKRLGRSSRLTAAPPKAESKPMNRNLGAAKAAKQDEFYTQYVDIQKEVEAYLEFDPDTFRGKVVYCNCDDPFESNFFKYFAANFNKVRNRPAGPHGPIRPVPVHLRSPTALVHEKSRAIGQPCSFLNASNSKMYRRPRSNVIVTCSASVTASGAR
jgi:hypothetical protein